MPKSASCRDLDAAFSNFCVERIERSGQEASKMGLRIRDKMNVSVTKDTICSAKATVDFKDILRVATSIAYKSGALAETVVAPAALNVADGVLATLFDNRFCLNMRRISRLCGT